MNGLLIIDKPKDYTSRDIVNIVGKHFKTKKVGHTGTLDPLATGVLVVAVNEGLKVVNLLTNEDKEYIVEVKCGLLTDTLDITGEVVEENADFELDKDKIKDTLNTFIGKSIQEVPIYSAVKVNGKKLYQYAREGKEVELPKKEIEISKIELLDIFEEAFSFKATVSKGTYIRSLVRDIGSKLGILCTMSNLRRTRVGAFNIDDANTLHNLEDGIVNVIDIKEVLKDFLLVEADDYLESRIKNGSILENRYDREPIVFINKEEKVLAIYTVYSKDVSMIKPIAVLK